MSAEDQSKKTEKTEDEAVKKIEENINELVLRKAKKGVPVDDLNKKHMFWDTQPVPKLSEDIKEEEQGPIEPAKTVEDVRKTPYNLPEGFEWCDTDIDDEKTIQEVYTLLNENYVEDDDNMFRFDYSVPFLRWALKPPGYYKTWHVGVRVTKNQKLVGFITGTPQKISVYNKDIMMAEINFLCVHKRLRDKRLAPVLIKEITRRVHLQNMWQAVYTAGKVLPKPIASCRYYHRSLNPKKLIDVGFSHLAPRMTMQRTLKLYKLPDSVGSKLRPMEKKDVVSATKLLNSYLSKYSIHCVFDEHEVQHWFLPIPGVMNSYVIEDPKTHEITDLASFYTLPSSILNNPNYKLLKAAYSFYNVATTISLESLIRDALVYAKKEDFDVYNCLDIMENGTFIENLKFGKGDGNLQYYLYNWKCSPMLSPKVGIVLL